jgi:hypothetical protein
MSSQRDRSCSAAGAAGNAIAESTEHVLVDVHLGASASVAVSIVSGRLDVIVANSANVAVAGHTGLVLSDVMVATAAGVAVS